MKTQNETILSLLKERGEQGINSFERVNGGVYATQLPRCINDLKKAGNIIVSKPNKDRSVTYVLWTSRAVVSAPKPKIEYAWKAWVDSEGITHSDYLPVNQEPEQLSL